MQVNAQTIIETYKQELSSAKHEVILLKACIQELQHQNAELKQKVEILQTRLNKETKETSASK
jgi:predicted metal-binding protein